jgi:hypothetical protein
MPRQRRHRSPKTKISRITEASLRQSILLPGRIHLRPVLLLQRISCLAFVRARLHMLLFEYFSLGGPGFSPGVLFIKQLGFSP